MCIIEGREKGPLEEGGRKREREKGRYIGGVPKESKGNGLSGMREVVHCTKQEKLFPPEYEEKLEGFVGGQTCVEVTNQEEKGRA